MSYIDAAERYIKLKKQGRNYFGLCPFHEEKTPSFSVNPDNGVWFCWGCGEKGNIYHLIERMESVKFPEAVEIAKGYGIDPPDNFKEKSAILIKIKINSSVKSKNKLLNTYESINIM